LKRAAASLSGVAMLRSTGLAQSAPQAEGPGGVVGASPLFLISLAQWSLNRAFAAKRLDPLDFPVIAKRDYAIDAVEYVNQFYKEQARDSAYVQQLRRRCDDHGVHSVLIMCDDEGQLGDPDDALRAKAVDNHRKWIEWAKALGCHSIRVNAASRGSADEQRRLAADGLARLTDVAARDGVNVIVENHGGLSSNGAWLASVIAAVHHPRCGTLPDFGNFRISRRADGTYEQYDRYQGVAELMPFAKGVSAKSYDFDESGAETSIDYRRMLRIVVDAGYRRHVGIEFEGERLSEPDGIRSTKALLERVRTDLHAEAPLRPATRPGAP
jgi:sugar phosphate isomerase/epimerase